MTTDPECTREQIDPRGPRFGAGVTTVVLAAALVFVGTPLGTVLLLWQTLVFAIGAIVGLQAHPYGFAYRRLVRPRLAAPHELEDSRPPRFAQALGLGFLLVAVLFAALGLFVVTGISIAAALVAAFLNAAFGLCLGCEVYLLGVRLARR